MDDTLNEADLVIWEMRFRDYPDADLKPFAVRGGEVGRVARREIMEQVRARSDWGG